MSRRACDVSPLRTYHVMARGVGGQIIFEDDKDRRLFLALLGKLLSRLPVALLAWTFVENHLHLVLKGERPAISVFMKRLLGQYAVAFNRRHGRKGHAFQDRFRRVAVMDERQLIATVRYVHQNAQRARLSDGCRYPWNSFGEYLAGEGLCDQRDVWDLIDTKEHFLELHDEPGAPPEALALEGSLRGASTPLVLSRAREALAPLVPGDVRSCERAERNAALCVLHRAGLSFRQIELVTGVPKSVAARVVRAFEEGAHVQAPEHASGAVPRRRRHVAGVRVRAVAPVRKPTEPLQATGSVVEWTNEKYMSNCSYKE